MASRHEIILSIIIIRKTQITTTPRVHLTLSIMVVVKNKQNKIPTKNKPSKDAGEDEGLGRIYIHCL